VEVEERISAQGEVLRPLELERVLAAGQQLVVRGVRSAAVALVNSYINPIHEQQLGRALREAGFDCVSCSAGLSPLITLLTRAETAVVDAALTPLVGRFLARVQRAVGSDGPAPLLVMTSAGGLERAESFRAKDSLLSGPAGGVVGAALEGRRAGFDKIISFDMGGTSTDVARYEGDYDYRFDQQVGDAHLALEAMAIESVAAGGGSICCCRLGALEVGPESAGAHPGPACYGAGGPLTVTDVNLLLGRLDRQRFNIPVDPERAEQALSGVRQALCEQTGRGPEGAIERDALLEGFVEIANERMADAIRRVSVRRGYEPKEHVLVAFGGAGPQHGCGVADRLQMDTILVPARAGLLSAQGIGHAVVEKIAARQVLRRLDEVEQQIPKWLDAMGHQAGRAVQEDGVPADQVTVRHRLVHLRFVGQDSTLAVDQQPGCSLEQAFRTRFEALYGYQPEGRAVEVESLRVIASSLPAQVRPQVDTSPRQEVPPPRRIRARFEGRWQEVACYDRESLSPGSVLESPAIVMDRYSTTVVEPGWQASVQVEGAILMRRLPQRSRQDGRSARADHHAEEVKLELFVGRLGAIAEEMGEMLRRTALSTNIKERRDFSCALLDSDGELVVNAPHIPVHLGSLGLCVRRLIEVIAMEPGDVVVTNHPGLGGSHLPDVTVVTPVYVGQQQLGYLASRAHHAEIGGITPGSMPPSATRLVQEGVVIAPCHLVSRGRPRWEAMRELLSRAAHPSRATEDNLADLRAAVAANHLGAGALQHLAGASSVQTLQHFMEALKARAEHQIRRALSRLEDGVYTHRGCLDDGSPLQVKVSISGDSGHVDFEGSAAVHPGNLNATPAIVRGVVIYVLRLLIDQPLPLNEGLMRAVTLNIPRGLLNPDFSGDPASLPAVVGGNVETSQRLVDHLLAALGLAACSQGTMNNVTFGSDLFGYYETVGGGTGAGPGFNGASAVHSHMTNTRITDVEVVEHRFPVRVERFAIRRGSGGSGLHTGGDGAIRELTFLEPVTLSLLAQRRATGPCGLAGGESGKPGAQRVIRASGQVQQLGGIDGCRVDPGDRLVLETPGGGGYGQGD
jgi:5-oxoprolinase (ATP-hydrolysing)